MKFEVYDEYTQRHKVYNVRLVRSRDAQLITQAIKVIAALSLVGAVTSVMITYSPKELNR